MSKNSQLGPNPRHTNGLCLLSLDGGGVRGLSSLLILKDVMTQLNSEREHGQVLKPCDVFDLIGGTSTGGLIAIMLGRLNMSVDECLHAYTELMESVFGDKISNVPMDWSGNIRPQYDSRKLKLAVEGVIERCGLSPTDPFNDGTPCRSRVFVCTTSKTTLQTTRLRSYTVPNENALSATICEAALATSAATGYFEPVTIEDCLFVDGAFGANNPIQEVEEEAADIWCTASRDLKPLVKCFVSIGTGNPAQVPIDDNLFKFLSKSLVRLATKPEGTERLFSARWRSEIKEKRFFRFNVEQGLQGIHMTEFQKQNLIKSATYTYLHHSSQKCCVRDCVLTLVDKEGKTNVDFETTIREYGNRTSRNRVLNAIPPEGRHSYAARPVGWVIPFERNTRYVDREVVGKVKRRLFIRNQPERIAIFGLGGVGKTQISLELAYQTKELYPDCSIFWLHALNMESIQQAYRMVAEQLKIDISGADADVKGLVQNHLSNPTAGRWLLIFDNADDFDMWNENEDSTAGRLRNFLPHSDQGAIVFTTRSNKVAQYLAATDIIEIPVMEEHKAIHVLRNSLVDKELLHDAEGTRQLLDRLTFLPLAIVQAASFINQNSMDIMSYVNLLDKQEQNEIDLLSEDFEDHGRYKSSRNPVATTWLTSFDQIRKQSPLAADFLCFISWVQERNIPIVLLPPATGVETQKAIGVLQSYSFVRVNSGGSTLDMHRLVQLASRNWLRLLKVSQAWQICAMRHLCEGLQVVDQGRSRVEWRVMIPHALHILNCTTGEPPTTERTQVLVMVAWCLTYDGRYREAEPLFYEIIDGSMNLQGNESMHILSGLGGLATIAMSQGTSEKAIGLFKEILRIRTNIHGPDHLDTIRAVTQLAGSYRMAEKFDNAEILYKKAIRHYLATLRPDSTETMDAIFGLTMVFKSQGKVSDSVELSHQSLQIARNTLGSCHIQTVFAMVGVAIIYVEQWRLKEAQALFTEAFDIQKDLLGPEHPATIRNMAWLATTLAYQGQRAEAFGMMKECIRLHGQVFGDEHPYTESLSDLLEGWTTSKSMSSFLKNNFSGFRRSEMMQERRGHYPKVKVYGIFHASQQPKNDPLVREIKEAINNMATGDTLPEVTRG
ncbi:Acyl transferase/acyl hydrolase/lysophospholipase [Penicillium nucicola]|uniref:Acyl transferase/acyl hydrolase/lysophospholipase n=1 Tax=Penicillium nucicola TaxID=1850975 RepID=UPI002545B34E|nr:Acyl transferase/acyl hydrolase/lysophospholipase [Penicillium nucicola]KAJ5765992.1 Acyl transferase/acyl hydrolase/lysophospholipase [Penicillium nucicola]